MRRDLLGLTLLGLTLCHPAYAETAPISIGYSFDGDTSPTIELFSTEPPIAAQIKLTAKIKNETDSDLALSEMTCSYYENWQTDNKAVEMEMWGCLRNFPHSHILKPGEVHTVPMNLNIGEISGDALHFKLGYKAFRAIFNPTTIPHDLGREEMKDGPFWSEEIVLPVKLASEEKQKYWHDKKKWQQDILAESKSSHDEDRVYITRYFGGGLRSERAYKNGKLNGPSKTYFENGKIQNEAFYVDDQLNGENKYYNDKGSLTSDTQYDKNHVIHQIQYNPDGTVHLETKQMAGLDGKDTTCFMQKDESLRYYYLPKCSDLEEALKPRPPDPHPALFIAKGLLIPKEIGMSFPENATIWLEDGVDWPEGIKLPKGTTVKRLPPGQTTIPSTPN